MRDETDIDGGLNYPLETRKSQTIIVGYIHGDYPYKRNIIGMVPDAEYKKVQDLFTMLNAWAPRLNQKLKREIFPTDEYRCKFNDFNLNKVSLFHFFNTISYGQTPWIATFETILPRGIRRAHDLYYKRKIRKALARIAGDSCKRIIAMSDCNANMQRDLLKNFQEYKERIESKLEVMHPPQKLYTSCYSDKHFNLEGTLKFMFVGALFFRKGGMEIVETFINLRERYGYDIELVVVSSLLAGNFATKEGPEDVERARNLIEQNSSWIRWYPKLKNDKTIELMKNSHIGLLPTYADTYGFSVLELQATGCPCITTNVRALPEINNFDTGWVIDVPKQQSGEAIYATKDDRNVISKLIRNGLEKTIHEIFTDRSIIAQKAEKSIARIKEHHSVERYAARMKNIYQEALVKRA